MVERATATCRLSAIVRMLLSGSGADSSVFGSYAAGYGCYTDSFSPGFVRSWRVEWVFPHPPTSRQLCPSQQEWI